MISFNLKDILTFAPKGAMFGIEFRTLKKQFGKLFLVGMQSVDSQETRGARINIGLKFAQKGAMFGIDARITFAVTAIAALIVGVNQFSDIERNNIDTATLDLREIKNSTLQYYKDKYAIATSADSLTTAGYMVYLRDNANYDPWGNTYSINSISNNQTIMGATVSVKYITLISAGKNGVIDTTVPTNIATWQALRAVNDDIILKFNTREVEESIAETETMQLKIVQNLLNNYVATKRQELSNYCDIVANQLKANCDINSDGKYIENEEFKLNFMLKNIDDNNGKYYIVKHKTHTTTDAKFKSGYINISGSNAKFNMYSFIDQIGGGAYLVKSPRGLVLHFNSNKYGSADFPYYSEVWYGNEITIF